MEVRSIVHFHLCLLVLVACIAAFGRTERGLGDGGSLEPVIPESDTIVCKSP